MALLPALEAGARFTIILGGPPTAVREFHSDLIPHEEPFVVLGNALLSGLSAFKFHETITKPIEEGYKISWRALGALGGHTLVQR